MSPEMQFRTELEEGLTWVSATGEVAWMNQATGRHVPHGFAMGTPKGMKSEPRHRDFRPGKEGVA